YYFYIYSFNNLCTGGPSYLGTSPLTGTTTTTTADYCTPSIDPLYQTSTNLHIRKVEFIGTLQDIVNNSSFPTVPTFGYENYTGLAVKSIQAKGEGVNIYMESPNSGYIKAWVDWNSNGSFEDAGEKVYDAGGTAQASTTLGFIVPTGIPAGDYRVRLRFSGRNISGSDAGYAWNSCTPNLAYYGETEDYILRVIENCAARIATVTNGDICGSGPVTLQATATAGTTEFRWYTTQTGGSYVATATGTWTTPSISATTVYWVTAYNGTCETLVRTKITAFVKPVPTLSFATSNTEVCGENSIVALTASGDNEIIYLLDEKFEGGMGTFSNVHYVSNAAVNAQTAWQIRTSPYVPTGLTWYPAIQSNFGTNNFAFVNSDIGQAPSPPGSYYTINNGLVSNTVNSTGFLSLTFKFRIYFDRYYPNGMNPANELMTIDVSTNNGTTWTPISGNITTDIGYGTRFTDYSYDLTGYIN
ncbi:MAG: GEVED domain-containing protein, partial [Bacteroidia bacterium]